MNIGRLEKHPTVLFPIRSPFLKCNIMEYKKQLQHPYWQRKRLEVMQRADFKCEICGSADNQLHVHHKEYIKGYLAWEYPMTNYECICIECHERIHKAKDGRVIEFPDYDVVFEAYEDKFIISIYTKLNGRKVLTSKQVPLDVVDEFAMFLNDNTCKCDEAFAKTWTNIFA